ncbi:MAG TPA: hypothetical protein VG408_03680, partial [Actinomycetota bacterium]|nr:hypothetical protein [Actinomycetota bacterium]
MSTRLRPRLGRRVLALALALLSVACTAGPSLAPRDDPIPAIDRFLAAWSARDYVGMWTMLDPESRLWTPGRLKEAIERILTSGAITGFEVTRVPSSEEHPGLYEITYDVPEPLDPVVLEG